LVPGELRTDVDSFFSWYRAAERSTLGLSDIHFDSLESPVLKQAMCIYTQPSAYAGFADFVAPLREQALAQTDLAALAVHARGRKQLIAQADADMRNYARIKVSSQQARAPGFDLGLAEELEAGRLRAIDEAIWARKVRQDNTDAELKTY
jgi:hypothetical protein